MPFLLRFQQVNATIALVEKSQLIPSIYHFCYKNKNKKEREVGDGRN
jgi:hypothetical protein